MVAETKHLKHASFAQVAADLLSSADADMLRNFGYGLDDQVEIADRNALGEQQLQHHLQARICDERVAALVGKFAVFGPLAFEHRLRVLVGQKLRQVVANHFGEVGERHLHVVGEVELLALQIFCEGIEH